MKQWLSFLTAAAMTSAILLPNAVVFAAQQDTVSTLTDFLLCKTEMPANPSALDADGNGVLNAKDLAMALRMPHSADDEWNLIWQDEFDGDAVDSEKWGYDIGNWLLNESGGLESYGWGNNEKQFYTDKNATVADSILTIAAKKEAYTDAVQGSYDYTSARMTTKSHFSTCGGKIEVRARVDGGKSLWPAIWMLPEDTVYGKWAASGEIDIMEGWGSTPEKVCGTIHFGDTWPNNTYLTNDYYFPSGESAVNFHTYSLEWDEKSISWFVDGECYSTQTEWYSAGRTYPAPFDQNFYLILNLAVGGNFDGVNGTEAEPEIFADGDRVMQIDYVRVYEKNGSTFAPSKLVSPSMSMYLEGGDADLSNSDNGTQIDIRNVGTLEYSVLGLYSKQAVKANQRYRVSCDVTCTVERTMRLTIEDSSYQRYLDEVVMISPESQHLCYEVTFPADMEADVKFQLGATEGAAVLSAHSVQIYGLTLEPLS